MLPSLDFASCYVYSPHGSCGASRRSRVLCRLLKAGEEAYLKAYAVRIRMEAQRRPELSGFFSDLPLIIPVPGCRASPDQPHGLAVGLAAAMAAQGLGSANCGLLRRVRSVPKSGTAVGGRRPTVAQHYESLQVDCGGENPRFILLIDDIVTKGRTLLAAATRVTEAFPGSTVRAFALMRTVGFAPEVDQILSPCVGAIRWCRGDARRWP